MKVLIVGNDHSSLGQLAGEWGYEATVAKNGAEAWQALKDEARPVVVITDLTESGEFCSRLKKERSSHQFYIILLVAETGKETFSQGLDAGADDFITAPVVPAEMRSRLEVGRRVLECQHAVESLTHELQAKNKELARMVTLDGLTGISSRASFDERLMAEWRRSLRDGAPISLIMIDIDFFKAFNDVYGHMVGDESLKRVARTVSENVSRAADFVARYGGEEFAVVLPNTDSLGSLVVAEAIRVAVATLGVEHKASTIHRYLTVSAGTATVVPQEGMTPEALVAKADLALYQAKKSGRNVVKQLN